MSVTFKSKVTGDLLMLSAHAELLLERLGKTARKPGILTPEQMNAALGALRELPDGEPHDDQHTEDDDVAAARQNGNDVSLRKRAWPLIKMIEKSQQANEPIVWGV